MKEWNQLIQYKHAYGTSKDLVSEKKEKEIKCNYNKMIQKVINFDDVTKEKIKEHNPNSTEIHDHPYRISIVGGSRSGKYINCFI